MSQKKRRRPVHLHVMVSEEELALIRERMAEAGVRNLGAYVRKMALNGYVLHVDLSPVRTCSKSCRRWWSFNPCRGAQRSPAAPASGHFVQRWGQPESSLLAPSY